MSAATPLQAPAAATGTSVWPAALRFGAVRFDSRRNGLNLVRLVLAYSVLVAHGWYISGDGVGPQLDGENIGGWAVFGFFLISGYLISGSRMTKPLGEYLVHRLARIYPAFLVCLALTAALFAPIGYWSVHGGLDGFLSTPTTPMNYVFANAMLRINAYDVAGTPGGVPYAGAWDGSLWSLYYEFLCYLVIAVLLSLAAFRRSPWPLAGAFVVSVVVHASMGRVGPYLQGNPDAGLLFKLLPFFLAGGLLYLLRDRIVLTWPGAVLSIGVAMLAVWQLDGWGAQLTAPFLAYAMLWLGAVLPCPDLIRRNDISYGVYIYAFPVQQLLAIGGADTWPLLVFDLVAIVATVPLAVASWVWVERPVMRRAKGTRRAVPAASALATAP